MELIWTKEQSMHTNNNKLQLKIKKNLKLQEKTAQNLKLQKLQSMNSIIKHFLMTPNQLLRNKIRNQRKTGTVSNKRLI
jgi:hypothetical protein